jgi:hypothetical protein
MTHAEAPGFHRAALTPREALLFEAGIKLGAVFHQFIGMPVSDETAPGLARTIESAVRLQPFVTDVVVHIDPAKAGPTGEGRLAYHYLVAEMLRVEVTLHDAGTTVVAALDHRADLRYPLMSVLTVSDELPPSGREGRSSDGDAR